ncbi:hypothetical protein P691DRAFT_781072 [Macrolepiota fuliginosa MF-IS2]|uniref:Uncharacterized protein n=1 Tax=Macrolepiota fuliginosa MF-IS2 TaxID=1400762 RepID=A0A9P5X059_9AGAR|nr:hypothetical protein P691DRAFT_781072 [Macrolepiota fuliginosa MF-IS2]
MPKDTDCRMGETMADWKARLARQQKEQEEREAEERRRVEAEEMAALEAAEKAEEEEQLQAEEERRREEKAKKQEEERKKRWAAAAEKKRAAQLAAAEKKRKRNSNEEEEGDEEEGWGRKMGQREVKGGPGCECTQCLEKNWPCTRYNGPKARVRLCAQCHQDGKGCFLPSGPSRPISGHKVDQVNKAPTELLWETRDTNNLLWEIGDQLGVLIEVSRENANTGRQCPLESSVEFVMADGVGWRFGGW